MRTLAIATVLWLVPAAFSAPVPPGPDDELHVVAVYQGNTKTGDMIHGGKASVKVDRPGKNVTLVVSAYDSVTWDITVAPRTNVKKVLVCGYHKQAANAPGGVEVLHFFREGREKSDFARFEYKIESGEFRDSVQELFRFTEQEISSFQGQSRFDPKKPFVVDAVQKDERLLTEFPRVDAAKNLPKFKFQAVYSIPVKTHEVSRSFGEFSQVGPDAASMLPLPKGIYRVVLDPATKKHYGITNHEIHEIDIDKQTSTKLDPGLGVPRLSWPRAIAFDSDRGTLSLSASRLLYEFTPKTGNWAALAETRGTEISALAYHPKDKTLYGIGTTFGGDGKNQLFAFNAKGMIAKTIDLGSPMFPGLLGRMSPSGPAQLLSVDDHLVAFVQTGIEYGGDRPRKPESFIYLIDPKTGKSQLAWKESR